MMFPVQYATKSMAETVAFFVKPPTLDVMRLSEMGILVAKGPSRKMPTHRPQRFESGSVFIKMTPTRAKTITTIMVIMRLFFTYAAVKQMQPMARIWRRPLGAERRSELSSLKPKPLMMMLLN
jgi:hypothetical protein